MKKITLFALSALTIISCSKDKLENETAQQNFNLTTIIESNQKPANSILDNTVEGLYRGVITTNDVSFNAKLTINLGNDGFYNALATTNEGLEVGFMAMSKSDLKSSTFQFKNDSGSSFDVEIVDGEAKVFNVLINSQFGKAQVYKETSSRGVDVVLGTFLDDADATFGGTWNLISTNTQVILVPSLFGGTLPVTVNIISDVVITKNDGSTYNDIVFEDIPAGTGCGAFSPLTDQAPFYTGIQNIGGFIAINEFALRNQSVNFLGDNCNYNFIFSKFAGNLYYNGDCTDAINGTWNWRGRTGSIFLNI